MIFTMLFVLLFIFISADEIEFADDCDDFSEDIGAHTFEIFEIVIIYFSTIEVAALVVFDCLEFHELNYHAAVVEIG